MKNDLTDRDDIERLINTFYDAVKTNPIIGPIFNDIARVDWQQHLPKMYSFWASLLLEEDSFSGNPMVKHLELSRLTPMTETAFSEWIRLFTQTVDKLFAGEKAEEAKVKATNIARLMLHKIQTL